MDDPQYKVYGEETRAMVDKLKARAFEEVHIISFDGLRLFGRWYEGKKDSPVVVLCHGYRGSAYRDFSGGSDIFLSLGWNVLLIDQRAHGKSEGSTITFGVKEPGKGKRALQSSSLEYPWEERLCLWLPPWQRKGA